MNNKEQNKIIKFRAWDKIYKCMVDVVDLHFNGVCEYINVINKEGVVYTLNHGNFILMQSTGLYDKNGNEIYEGDIIRRKGTTDLTIQYSNGRSKTLRESRYKVDGEGLYIIELDVRTGMNYQFLKFDYAQKWVKNHVLYLFDTKPHFLSIESANEVIGNIYQNKELLK
jgi:uncharacterized phage protein (TIGR01671 family)